MSNGWQAVPVQNCQLAKQVVEKSRETVAMISNYSIRTLSRTLKRKTLEKLNNKQGSSAKLQQQENCRTSKV